MKNLRPFVRKVRHVLTCIFFATVVSILPTQQALAQLQSALNFDGQNDYVAINNPFTAFGKEITVEWWVNPSSTPQGSGIGQATSNVDNNANSNVWLMHFWNTNTLTFFVNDNGTWRATPEVSIPLNTWTHLVGVADATSTRLYMNGTLVATGQGVSGNIFNNASSVIHFGKDVRFNLGRFLTGSMDEVRIWNRALCIDEILNNRTCQLPTNQNGLIGYYKFNEGSAGGNNTSITSLIDHSSNNRHGSFVNMALNGTGASNYITQPNALSGSTCNPYIPPAISASNNGPAVSGASIQLSATAGFASYSWSGPNGFSSNAQNPVINNATTAANGTYTVKGTNATSCSNTASTSVTVNTAAAAALNFDGANDYVSIPSGTNISNQSFTFECWAKANAVNRDNIVAGQGTPSTNVGLHIGFRPNNVFTFAFFNNDLNTSAGFTDLNWHHWACVYEVSASGNTRSIYRDGILVAQDFPTSHYAGTGVFNIGRHWSGSNFQGNIDEVRIWNRALCQGEIQNNMNCELGSGQIGLLRYYKFNQGFASDVNSTVNTLTDASGNNVNATLNNFALTGVGSNWVAPGGVTTGSVCGSFSPPTIAASSNSPVTATQSLQLNATAGFNAYAWTGPNGFTSNLQNPIINNVTTAAAGSYTVTGTLANGCKNSASTAVSINACTAPTMSGCPQTAYEQVYTPTNACGVVLNYNITIGGSSPQVSYTFSGATTGSGNGTGSGSTFNVGQTSVVVTASNGCGTVSCTFVVTVIDNIAPTVIAQNRTVYLDANGQAAVTAADINNGSTDNCGPVSLSLSNTGTICGFATENQVLTLAAPAGAIITEILFASYGNASGNCGTYALGSCHASTSLARVQEAFIGRNSGSITASNGVFGDPCFGTVKRLVVQARWSGIGTAGEYTCLNIGPNPIILNGTDVNGRASSATATVTVLDTIKPFFTFVPSNMFAAATSPAGAIVHYSLPTATDNCTPTVTRTAGLASGSQFPIGITSISYRVTDSSGNFVDASFDIEVGGLAPVISGPGNISVNTTPSSCDAIVQYAATETIGIPASTINYSIAPGSAFPVGTTQVTATATNAVGSSSVTFDVTVTDNQLPTVVTQNVTVQLDASGNASITAAQVNNGSTDNCGIASMHVSQSSFDCNDVSLTACSPNAVNITGSTSFINVGNQAPFNMTAAITMEAWVNPAQHKSIATVLAKFGDVLNNDAYTIQIRNGIPYAFIRSPQGVWHDAVSSVSIPTNQWSHIAGTFDGTTVRIFVNGVQTGSKAYAGTINVSNATFKIGGASALLGGQNFNGLIDEVAIWNTARSAADIAATASKCYSGNESGLVAYYKFETGTGTTAFDQTANGLNGTFNNTSSITWSTQQAPVQTAAKQVILTVTDNNNNTATGVANVTVVDAILPVISCGSDIHVFATSAAGAVVTYATPNASDNCSASVNRTAGLASGANFPLGTTTVTHEAVDPSGNKASCSFTVTVTGVAPAIVSPGNISVNTDPNACHATVSFSASETTGIPASTITYSTVPGSTFPVGTTQVTATATNAVGSSSVTFDVTVSDNQLPTVVTQNVSVQLDANGNASITAAQVDNGSNDACGIASMTVSPSNFTCANVGANTVTLTVTDVNGKTNTATAEVTVSDITAPNVLTQNLTVDLDASGNASITAAQVDNGSSDASGNASMRVSPSSFTCANVGANIVILTVTDLNGNSQTANATVTVRDVTLPQAVAQNLSISLDASGNASITAAQIDNGSSDACGIASMSISPSSFTCANVGTNTVTLTVTDVNGNVNTATAVVTVNDVTAPVVATQSIGIALDANGQVNITAAQIDNGSADACGIASMSVSPSSFTCANVGANTVTLTVTDVHGNVNTATAVVTVADQTAPQALTQNISVHLDANGNASVTVAQVDNGSNDACGIASMSVSPSSFSCANVGANTVTLTVTDVNGNSNTTTAVVSIADVTPPTVITQNVSVTLVAGAASITAAQINNGSYDACGIASIVVAPSNFDCSDIGDNTVTLTVTDVNGNVASATATVAVVGAVPVCNITSAPNNTGTVIGSTTTLAAVNQMFLGYGAQSMRLMATASNGGPFTYAWSGSGLSSNSVSNPIFTPTAAGNYTFTCTVTNQFGCQTTCEITICVIDVRDPKGNARNPKVLICHIPPGNPNNPQSLSVGVSAVPAHLGLHGGDRLGTCNSACGLNNGRMAQDVYETVENGDIHLTVYPNPSNREFNFVLEHADELEKASVLLYDMNGKLVYQLAEQQSNVPMVIREELAAGVYNAHVRCGSFFKVVKVTRTN